MTTKVPYYATLKAPVPAYFREGPTPTILKRLYRIHEIIDNNYNNTADNFGIYNRAVDVANRIQRRITR
jgi:hypothetical protein